MSSPQLLTYRDAVDAAVDFLSGQSTTASQQGIRRAIHAAYREIAVAHDWSWLYRVGRVQLEGAYSTGTVTYTHTGGSYERQLVLSDGTWPSWVNSASVRVDDIVCHIEDRKSDTYITLDADVNPGDERSISAATFTVYPHYYALPSDFISFSGPWGEDSNEFGRAVSYNEWLRRDRNYDYTGSLRVYCVHAPPDLYGSMGLFIHPPRDSDATCDFMYKRRPRQLRYTGHNTSVDSAGTVTTNGTALLSGSSTAFEDNMVGAIVRIGDSASTVPTGLDGVSPFVYERSVKAQASATSITLDDTVATTSGKKYVVSDPIDIDVSAYDAFLACVYKHLSIGRNMKNKGEFIAVYQQLLQGAKRGDYRVSQRRVAGCTPYTGPNFTRGSIGADVS